MQLLLSGIFLIAFGVYAILVSLRTYRSKTVVLVTGRRLHGERAQITSILDTVIGVVVLGLGLFALMGDFLLPN
jgi:hypothetical protein